MQKKESPGLGFAVCRWHFSPRPEPSLRFWSQRHPYRPFPPQDAASSALRLSPTQVMSLAAEVSVCKVWELHLNSRCWVHVSSQVGSCCDRGPTIQRLCST